MVLVTQIVVCALRFALLFLAVRYSSFGLSVLCCEQPRTQQSPPPSIVCAERSSANGLRLLSVAKNYLFASASLWLCALGVGCELFVSLRFALLINNVQPYTVPQFGARPLRTRF